MNYVIIGAVLISLCTVGIFGTLGLAVLGLITYGVLKAINN